MKTYKLGFVGAGNMAAAIINGAIVKNIALAENIFVYDIDAERLALLKEQKHVVPVQSIDDLCKKSDYVFLAIKPNVMADILKKIKDLIGDKPIVSIVAGWNADMIKEIIGHDKKVMRLMPNTPLMVGEGMSVIESPHSLSTAEAAYIESLLRSLGLVEYAPQKAMDAVTAVSGSGPAYVFMFIEALSDAGVLCGLPRDQVIKLAAQTVLGSAKMVLETGKHPGVLKDAVCSPGGTTIEAVKSLEQDSFRGSIIKAVEQCAIKSKALAK